MVIDLTPSPTSDQIRVFILITSMHFSKATKVFICVSFFSSAPIKCAHCHTVFNFLSLHNVPKNHDCQYLSLSKQSVFFIYFLKDFNKFLPMQCSLWILFRNHISAAFKCISAWLLNARTLLHIKVESLYRIKMSANE